MIRVSLQLWNGEEAQNIIIICHERAAYEKIIYLLGMVMYSKQHKVKVNSTSSFAFFFSSSSYRDSFAI